MFIDPLHLLFLKKDRFDRKQLTLNILLALYVGTGCICKYPA